MFILNKIIPVHKAFQRPTITWMIITLIKQKRMRVIKFPMNDSSNINIVDRLIYT